MAQTSTHASEKLTDAEYRLLSEFRFQIRSFLHLSESLAGAEKLQPQQHQLLLALKGLPEPLRPTLSTLAQRLCLRHHSTVELVNRMQTKGIVKRNVSDNDGREVLVTITPKGEQILERLSQQHWQELEGAAPDLANVLDRLIHKQTVRKGNQN